MEIESIKKRIEILQKKKKSLELEKNRNFEETQRIVIEHNALQAELKEDINKIEGKIEILTELVKAAEGIQEEKEE